MKSHIPSSPCAASTRLNGKIANLNDLMFGRNGSGKGDLREARVGWMTLDADTFPFGKIGFR